MAIGKSLGVAVNGSVTIQPTENEKGSFTRLRIETGAGFDRTITIKKRPRQEGSTVLTPLATWYKKESDGSIASAPLTPGASSKSEYLIDGVSGSIVVEVTGGTTGTVDFYWTTTVA